MLARSNSNVPIGLAFGTVCIGASLGWADWLNIEERTGSADSVSSEGMSLAILSADNPLPETGPSSATRGHRAGSSHCRGVIIGVSGGHVALNDVLLPGDQSQRRDED